MPDKVIIIGSLRSYGGRCNENDTFKYNFSLGSVFLRLFNVCHVIRNRQSVLFVFFGPNAFHVKAENEKLIASDLCCRQKLKYENFTSSFGRLRQKLHQKSCRTCSTIIFPHSTNQIINLWRCRGRCRRHFLNSLFAIRVRVPREDSA